MESGILLLNKGSNITSNSVITKAKWTLKNQGFELNKIGHAGTLDPNATGLLVVLINDATKISDYLLLNDKEYEARVRIGESYDTLDIWGKLEDKVSIDESELNNISANIDNVLKNLTGKINQIPPIYSSIKYKGKKLYQYARENKEIDLSFKSREIEVFDLFRLSEVKLENDYVEVKIKCHVSKGTYIRSLCKMIGECLGYPSCMSELNRTKSGEFSIANSYTITEIEEGKFHLVKILDALSSFTQIQVDDKMRARAKNGQGIKIYCDEEEVILKDNDNLLAIYKKESENYYKAKRVWL